MIELRPDARVFIAGHGGLVGSAIMRRPDGTPRKLLDVGRLHAPGWRHKIGLREGIESSYRRFLENQDRARGAEPGPAA